ncbi:MAG: hypothetical protein Q8S23_06085 [Bacteroidales bacterium]|jgi:hypothetical protein|nr:hypothetical protein [Bacteroidales bacterium]
MKEEKDYIKEISEIRSMMERSSKFLSLSGWAGIMAGIYALVGVYVADSYFGFNPQEISDRGGIGLNIILLATVVLIFAIFTAILLSYKRAGKREEKLWNSTTRRLVINMAVPLISGGVVILILASKGLVGLIAPLTMIFYGLALFNVSGITIKEIKGLGINQIILGLIGLYFVEYGLLLWALGFGVAHILYGIVMYFKYERG